jgi:hypothetical protein
MLLQRCLRGKCTPKKFVVVWWRCPHTPSRDARIPAPSTLIKWIKNLPRLTMPSPIKSVRCRGLQNRPFSLNLAIGCRGKAPCNIFTLILLVMLAACGANPPLPPPTSPVIEGWPTQAQRSIDGPAQHVAFIAEGGQAWQAWPGPPDQPNIRLANGPNTEARLLPLGIAPRALSLWPLSNGWLQLLWLDQTLKGRSELVGGTLDAEGNLQRGPTSLARANVLEYTALADPNGDLLVVWAQSEGDLATALYAARIDGLGRPRAAVRLASDARFPALHLAGESGFLLAWVSTGSVWAVQATLLSWETFPDNTALNPTPVALAALKTGQTLSGLALSADSRSFYLLWEVLTAGSAGAGVANNGLIFPMVAIDDMRQSVSFSVPSPLALRGLAGVGGGRLRDGALFSGVADFAGSNQAFVLTVGADGTTSRAAIGSAVAGWLGNVSLWLSQSGKLQAVWSGLLASGESRLYWAAE